MSSYDFVNSNLEDGYNTQIGERGVKLSAGNVKRSVVLHTLYHNPSVLVLDEATSALDNTERIVMDSIKNLGREITIIIIAHRLSTIRDCDTIYHLDKGNIVSKGTYKELIDIDKKFSEMVDYEDHENKKTVAFLSGSAGELDWILPILDHLSNLQFEIKIIYLTRHVKKVSIVIAS